jgi:hypothetical protein
MREFQAPELESIKNRTEYFPQQCSVAFYSYEAAGGVRRGGFAGVANHISYTHSSFRSLRRGCSAVAFYSHEAAGGVRRGGFAGVANHISCTRSSFRSLRRGCRRRCVLLAWSCRRSIARRCSLCFWLRRSAGRGLRPLLL